MLRSFAIRFFTATALSCIATATLARGEVEVLPTGIYPDDMNNVQAAIDSFGANGSDGVLVLKAHTAEGVPMSFNFSEDPDPTLRGSVLVGPDHEGSIEFRGERVGNEHTVIVGGNAPIQFDRASEITVRDIEFRRPYLYAIEIDRATGVKIGRNTIIDLGGADEPGKIGQSRAINIISVTGELSITGPVSILDNIIQGSTALYADAMTLTRIDGPIEVIGNTISGVQVGVRLSATLQTTSIIGNEIQALLIEPDFFATGIQLNGNGPGAGSTIIDGNVIHAYNAVGLAQSFVTGISFTAFDQIIRNVTMVRNDITLHNTHMGIDITAYGVGNNPSRIVDNRIFRNTLHGTTSEGIVVEGLNFGAVPELSGNRIVANDLRDITQNTSDLYFSTVTERNAAAVRADDVVVDLGIDNTIVIVGE